MRDAIDRKSTTSLLVYVPKFLAALEDLKNSMMLCGHPHYIEEISSFMDEMEKMKGALHGDENDAAQETEQKRTA